MHRITLKQLEVFTAIAQRESVTQAANHIGLSQAAASQTLADIEYLLGKPLFARTGRRVVLNTEGKTLLSQAMDILDRVKAIESPENNLPLSLRIGASPTVGSHHLAPIISTFLSQKPPGHVHVDMGNSEHTIRALLRFDIDVGFIEGKNCHDELLATTWREDQLIIIAHPRHPLVNKTPSAQELAQSDWILGQKGSEREIFEQAIMPAFQTNRVRLETSSNHAVIQAVMHGIGLACVSQEAVRTELARRDLVAIQVPWLDLRRTLSIIVHRHKHLSRPLLAFLQQCGLSVMEDILRQLMP